MARIRKKRILVLMHQDLVPPNSLNGMPKEEKEAMKTEWDVTSGLKDLGHDVHKLGLYDEILPLRQAITEFKPHIAFNLMEEFHGNVLYDHNVVSYLELMRQPYTGCNPRGLILARDKALSKKLLHYHRIPVPDFAVFPVGRQVRLPRRLRFPLIVKSLLEEASHGISQASLVENEEKLRERVEFVHRRVQTAAIAEEFIDGREIYVGILGNRRLEALPPWELRFTKVKQDVPFIATAKVKWDRSYQTKLGVTTGAAADLDEDLARRLLNYSKRIYRHLDLSGYARIDFRLDANGKPYFLEANPNPQIAEDEDLADSAYEAGYEYEELLQKVVNIGLRAK